MKSEMEAYVIKKGNRWLGRKYPTVRTTVLSKHRAKVFYGYYAALHALLETRDLAEKGRLCQVNVREVEEIGNFLEGQEESK